MKEDSIVKYQYINFDQDSLSEDYSMSEQSNIEEDQVPDEEDDEEDEESD